jgi:hypothetical protein
MASKGKAYARHMPVIYPDTVRPPPALPDAASFRAERNQTRVGEFLRV